MDNVDLSAGEETPSSIEGIYSIYSKKANWIVMRITCIFYTLMESRNPYPRLVHP